MLDSIIRTKLEMVTEIPEFSKISEVIFAISVEIGLSCSWLGSGSYVVIDLSAGPCEYGPLHGKGAVSADTLPSLTR